MKTLYDWSKIPARLSAGATDKSGDTYFYGYRSGRRVGWFDVEADSVEWSCSSGDSNDIICEIIDGVDAPDVPWLESFELRPAEVGDADAAMLTPRAWEDAGLTYDHGNTVIEPDGTRHGFCDPREVLAFIRGYQARREFAARAANLNDAPDSCTHGADDYSPSYDPTEDEK